MGAFSANLPVLMVTAGARQASFYKGQKIGTGTDLWRVLDDWHSDVSRGKVSRLSTYEGGLLLYQQSVLQSNFGYDLDFLCAPTPKHRRFVSLIVGRS